MSNAASAARTVTVRCKCGNMFDREVKRGRPQVWCPPCIERPFYDREVVGTVAVVTTSVNEETGEIEVSIEASRREAIEAAVKVQYAAHAEAYATLIGEGLNRWDAAAQVAHMISAQAMQAVYDQFPKAKVA